MIPYGRQWISDEDVAAVVAALRSDWLTTGPLVDRFEGEVARISGAQHAVAVSNGTAALHAMLYGAGVGPGDEVIVPPMTFAATSNAVLYCGAKPVFADVDPGTLLLDPAAAQRALTPRTRAILSVDYAGQPCDHDAIRAIAPAGVAVLSDAAHSLGGADRGRPVGSLADATTYSFHPVKHITTGEGGMIVTDRADWASRMRRFRNHGIDSDHRTRSASGAHRYAMVDLGYNYRLTDIQCALGLSQIARLREWVDRRRAIAAQYDAAFAREPGVRPLARRASAEHAFHLYVVRIDARRLGVDRDAVHAGLRARGIGANVHYVPVHLHPYYREQLGMAPGLCPVAEEAYGEILSLPMFPAMTDADVATVVDAVRDVASRGGKA